MIDDASPVGPLLRGERVLWRGRLAVGAPWPSFGRLALGASIAWAVFVLASFLTLGALLALPIPSEGPTSGAGPSAWSIVPGLATSMAVAIGTPTLTVAISKVVGPSYGRILWLLVVSPGLLLCWALLVEHHGWPGAIQRVDPELALLAAVFVGLPATWVVRSFLARLEATCAVTDRRLLVANAAGRVIEETAYTPGHDDDLRVERTWRAPGGVLCAGYPWAPLRMPVALRDDDPVQVLALVRAVREGSRT